MSKFESRNVDIDELVNKTAIADEKIFVRGSEKYLELRNITYEHEGIWVCVASNTIKGI